MLAEARRCADRVQYPVHVAPKPWPYPYRGRGGRNLDFGDDAPHPRLGSTVRESLWMRPERPQAHRV